MRVVIDGCVWVASVRSRRGASFALLSEISHNRFQFGISVPLFCEYRERLHETVARDRAGLRKIQVDAVLSALAFYCVDVPNYFWLGNVLFECAANFGASIIITHNAKDFLNPELENYEIEILTPGRFIKRLRK